MAGMNWQKYLMPEESFGTGPVDNTAMTDPYAFPQLDWMDALKIKRMSEGPYSPYKTPFTGAEDQDTLFDPYNKPKVDVRNPPVDWNSAPNQGTLFDPYSGGAPTTSPNVPRPTSRVSEPAIPERTGGPTDWARNALNTGFNPTYQHSNPEVTTPPFVAPGQPRIARPQVSRPPSAPRRVASPTVGPTAEPAPVSAQPSYTRQEPIDFASLLSGAAKKGGGAYGDFGAAGMLGPEERAAQAAEAQRIANQPKMPEYDYGPMQRYQEYLKAEPDRDQYKPDKWGRILNAASAGVQSYNTGDIGQGIKLGEYLNQQPYENAFKKWQGKGTRYAADATMAETRYKNQVEAFNKRADNERADAALKLTERGVNIQQAKLYLDIQKAADSGFQKITGPDGMMYLQKVQDGQLVTMPTGMPATEYTVVQKMAETAGLERGRMQRHVTPSGSAVLGANTSTANTLANNVAADLRLGRTLNAQGERQGIDIASRENLLGRTQTFQAGQNDLTREVTTRGQNMNAGVPPTAGGYPVAPGVRSNVPGAPGGPNAAPNVPGDAVPGPRASSLASPLTTITQAYKEFNSPDFVKIGKGPKGETTIEFNSIDSPTVKEAIKRMSGGDPALFKFYTDRWVALRKANGL